MTATVLRLGAPDLAAHLPAFARILHACVQDGASVGFILPFSPADAEAYWRHAVFPPLTDGKRFLLAAFVDDRPVGTVQLLIDMPPNQPHRAEVMKLLVHPDQRRRGLARALMTAIEAQAHALDRSLLTLDTRSGDPAKRLYVSLGYRVAGEIPDWCRDTFTPDLCPTTILFKRLSEPLRRQLPR